MTFSYSLYGLNLRSNLPLPGLSLSDSSNSPDVEITLGQLHEVKEFQAEPWFASPYLDENGEPYLIAWKSTDDSAFLFVYGDATQFLIDRKGARVSAIWPASLNLENTTVYLVGQVAAFLLRLRGSVALHASSILVDNKVIAIAGDTGAGKSSTAANFARLGYSVLSEDVTALADRESYFLVQPGYPRVNLWPEAATCVRGMTDSLPAIAPTWNKTYLDLQQHGDRFARTPAPLGAVYVLDDRINSDSAPRTDQLTRQDALISLLRHTHGRYLLEKPMRLREFELLSRVVDSVPIRRAIAHTDLDRLDRLCEAIIADYKTSMITPVRREEDSLV